MQVTFNNDGCHPAVLMNSARPFPSDSAAQRSSAAGQHVHSAWFCHQGVPTLSYICLAATRHIMAAPADVRLAFHRPCFSLLQKPTIHPFLPHYSFGRHQSHANISSSIVCRFHPRWTRRYTPVSLPPHLACRCSSQPTSDHRRLCASPHR